MVESVRHDLILMDIQMPVMDGLQAAREIRKLQGGLYVPILAMTANAFEEDRRNCIDAGMNDHIPKPVEPEELFQSLIKWITPRKKNMQNTGNDPRERAAAEKYFTIPDASELKIFEGLGKIDGLDVTSGLKTLQGDKSYYLSLLKLFVESHGGKAQELNESVAKKDYDTVRAITHALKGVFGNLGALDLYRLTTEIEKMQKENADPKQLSKRLKTLSDELSKLIVDLQTVLPQRERPKRSDSEMDTEEPERLLDTLERLLEKNDTAADETFGESKDLLYRIMGDTAGKIESDIQKFDFFDALTELQNWRAQVKQ